jgi:hypothetical protein
VRTSGDTLTDGTHSLTLVFPTTTCCTSSAVTDVSGNTLWLKADDLSLANAAAVSSWTDASATGNNAVQATATNQPTFRTNVINGKPVVRFDGSNDFLTLNTNPSPPASHTIFAVISTSNYAAGDVFFGAYSGALTSSWAALWTFSSTNPTCTGGLQFGFGNGTDSRYGSCSGESQLLFPGNDIPIVLTYRYNSGSSSPEIYSNGYRIKNPGSTTGTATSVLTSAIPFSIGRRGNEDNYYADQDIAEFLIFDSALSDTNRERIEGYLMTKYGLGPKATSLSTRPATNATTNLQSIGGSGSFKYMMAAGKGRVNASAQFETPSSSGLSVVKSLDASNNPDYILVETGATTNSLKLWLKPEAVNQSDGSTVCRWLDSGPDGNHTWATSGQVTRSCGAANAPTFETSVLNSRPVVRFVEGGGANGGAGQKLSTGVQLSPPTSSGYTVVGVASTTTLSTSWIPCLWGAATSHGSAMPYAWGMLQFTANAAGVMRYLLANSSGGTTSQGRTSSAAFGAINTHTLVAQRHTSGDAFDDIYINGTQISTTAVASSLTDPQGGSPIFTVGGCGAYLYRFWEGDIAEVMVFNRNLSNTELGVIHRYFAGKFGISLP